MIALSKQAFWSGEVAAMLGVQDVTVRSWALRLEKYGYLFVRDSNDKRAYSEHDISVLRYLQTQVQDRKLKLNVAAQLTAERFKTDVDQEENGIAATATTESVTAIKVKYDAIFEAQHALLERLEQQEKTQLEILARLVQQAERQEQRDQALMQTMRELLEQRRLEVEKHRPWWRRR